ncbi:hypothetical protein V8C43DRAFT_268729 [Trichoderma afarasin]
MLLTDKSVSPPKHGPERPPDGVHSSLCLTANKPSQYGRRRRFQYLSQGGGQNEMPIGPILLSDTVRLPCRSRVS